MVGQVQGQVDVLMHLVLLIPAGLQPDGLPRGTAQGHVGAEEEVVLVLGQLEHQLAHLVVGLEAEAAHRHVVVDHGPVAACTDVVREGLLDLLHPVRFQHRVSVDPAQDIAGGVVQAEVPGGDEALVLVLAEQDDRALRVFQLHLPDDLRGAVLGHVVHHDDLVGGDRLVDGGDQALPNDAFLVVRRNNDGDGRRRRSIVWGIHGGFFG